MALDTCGECGQQVSTTADSCPHCGAVFRRARQSSVITFRGLCSAFLFLLGGLAALVGAFIPGLLLCILALLLGLAARLAIRRGVIVPVKR